MSSAVSSSFVRSGLDRLVIDQVVDQVVDHVVDVVSTFTVEMTRCTRVVIV